MNMKKLQKGAVVLAAALVITVLLLTTIPATTTSAATGDLFVLGGGGGGGGAGGYIGDTDPGGGGGDGGNAGNGQYGYGGEGGIAANDGAEGLTGGISGAGGDPGIGEGGGQDGTAGMAGQNVSLGQGGTGGTGGNASDSIAATSFNLVYVAGGNGGNSGSFPGDPGNNGTSGTGGVGGNASLSGTDLGAGNLSVISGSHGTGNYSGAGGSATLSLTGTLTAPSITITKPSGGGAVNVRVGTLDVSADTTITVDGTAASDVEIETLNIEAGYTLTIISLNSGTLTIDTLSMATGSNIIGASYANISPAIGLVGSSLPNGTVGTPYSQSIASDASGYAPYSFATHSTMPAGLTLDATGTISGTPTVAVSNYSISVTVTDELGRTATQTYALTIGLADQSISINDPGTLTYGDNSFTISAAGYSGTGEITFSVPDSNGVLSITGDTAVIIGAGRVTVTVNIAADQSYSSASNMLAVDVGPRDISNATITVNGGPFTYTGSQLMPDFNVSDGSVAISDNDYTYAYGNNITVAEGGTIVLTGQGNYTGTQTVTFDIAKATSPKIVWPTAGSVSYGSPLSSSVLTGGSTNGTFAWANGSVVPVPGNSGYKMIFTPNDTDNYDYSGVATTQTIAVSVTACYITASADANSVVSPSGAVALQRGGDQTFTFSAADGYYVSAVKVDGVSLTSDQIGLESYTFKNIIIDHTIAVSSAPGSAPDRGGGGTGTDGNTDVQSTSSNGNSNTMWWVAGIVIFVILICVIVAVVMFLRRP